MHEALHPHTDFFKVCNYALVSSIQDPSVPFQWLQEAWFHMLDTQMNTTQHHHSK